MPAAFTGFGELAFITTDNTGPNSQEGGYFPFPASFTVEKTTEIVKKFAFKPCGGTGKLQQVAGYTAQEEWTGTMTINVASWLDLQFLYGQKAKTATQTYWDVACAVPTANVITNAALVGKAVSDLVVTWIDYDATAGTPIQLEVIPSPDTASATEVVFDSAAGTLTFAAQFAAVEISYAYKRSASKSVIGLSNPTLLTGFEFYGQIATNAGSTAAGYGLYIPSLFLDGNFSVSLTGGDDAIDVPFTPILKSGYSEPVVLIQL